MTFPNVKNDAGASTKAQKSPCFFELAPASFLTFGKVNPGPPQTDIFFWRGPPPTPPSFLSRLCTGHPQSLDFVSPSTWRRRRPLRKHGWPDEAEVEWTVARPLLAATSQTEGVVPSKPASPARRGATSYARCVLDALQRA